MGQSDRIRRKQTSVTKWLGQNHRLFRTVRSDIYKTCINLTIFTSYRFKKTKITNLTKKNFKRMFLPVFVFECELVKMIEIWYHQWDEWGSNSQPSDFETDRLSSWAIEAFVHTIYSKYIKFEAVSNFSRFYYIIFGNKKTVKTTVWFFFL